MCGWNPKDSSLFFLGTQFFKRMNKIILLLTTCFSLSAVSFEVECKLAGKELKRSIDYESDKYSFEEEGLSLTVFFNKRQSSIAVFKFEASCGDDSQCVSLSVDERMSTKAVVDFNDRSEIVRLFAIRNYKK